MRKALFLALVALLLCAQAPISSFPPGSFSNRGAMDPSSGWVPPSGLSLIFTAASSQYLSVTGKTSINRQKFTIAFWFKRASISTDQFILFFGASTANDIQIDLSISNLFIFQAKTSGSAVALAVPTAIFTDTTSWHHALIAVDTTQETAANRLIIYIDGFVSALSVPTYPAQNANLSNNFASTYYIGQFVSNSNYFNGNLAQFYYIDGQQLNPTSFISGTPGVPIAYTGTYTGTFDFFLPFSDSTSTTTLGADGSGEGNNWTLNAMTTANSSSDYP